MGMSTLLCNFCCEIHFSKNNVGLGTVTPNKAFCKSTDNGVNRIIYGKKANPYPELKGILQVNDCLLKKGVQCHFAIW